MKYEKRIIADDYYQVLEVDTGHTVVAFAGSTEDCDEYIKNAQKMFKEDNETIEFGMVTKFLIFILTPIIGRKRAVRILN